MYFCVCMLLDESTAAANGCCCQLRQIAPAGLWFVEQCLVRTRPSPAFVRLFNVSVIKPDLPPVTRASAAAAGRQLDHDARGIHRRHGARREGNGIPEWFVRSRWILVAGEWEMCVACFPETERADEFLGFTPACPRGAWRDLTKRDLVRLTRATPSSLLTHVQPDTGDHYLEI